MQIIWSFRYLRINFYIWLCYNALTIFPLIKNLQFCWFLYICKPIYGVYFSKLWASSFVLISLGNDVNSKERLSRPASLGKLFRSITASAGKMLTVTVSTLLSSQVSACFWHNFRKTIIYFTLVNIFLSENYIC